MTSDGSKPLLAALGGFVAGGLAADAFRDLAAVLLPASTMGGIIAAFIAAARGRDIASAAAMGGGVGLVAGGIVLLADLWVGA